MSPFTITFLLLLPGTLWWLVTHLGRPDDRRKPPPGPRGLPVLGSLHILGKLPHQTLHRLSERYGPIMSVHLGVVPAVVVSSARAAELFLKTHDAVFASRPRVQSSEFISHGAKGMAFTPYGPYWRSVRKFCVQELLNPAKIESMEGMRREEIGEMLTEIQRAARSGKAVDVTEAVAGLIENFVYRMLFGRSKDERFDLKGTIQEAMYMTGAFNIADFLPALAPLDLQGLSRRLKENGKAVDKILESIICEHERDATPKLADARDFVDVMLSMKDKQLYANGEFTIHRTNMKAIILDMIVGSIGTSNTAIEWTMAELLKHRWVLKRVQQELESVVGREDIVGESDLPKLEYLNMVIKESFRLHPVAPLLVPRESMEDITIDGHFIPKNSRVIINAWAIGRDPGVWSNNANEFLPERFIGSDVDVYGHHYELTPFGSGRRQCPGMNLGLINVRLVLAQLLHSFDWDLPDGTSADELDMDETFGLSMPRAKHLLAVPSYRF